MVAFIYFYYKANYLFTSNNNNWLKYNFTFHLFVGIQSFMITYHLPIPIIE